MFTPYLFLQYDAVIGFADNRYSNGGDLILLDYIIAEREDEDVLLDMYRFCYAGWNTDGLCMCVLAFTLLGNTLGTVIANTIILSVFQDGEHNSFFNTLRILEDEYYQATVRQWLQDYVDNVNDATISDLSSDLPFYDRFSYKVESSLCEDIVADFDLPWVLDSCYYPWNRTFEIGFTAH